MTENEIIDFREQQAQHHARLRKIEGLMQYLNPLPYYAKYEGERMAYMKADGANEHFLKDMKMLALTKGCTVVYAMLPDELLFDQE